MKKDEESDKKNEEEHFSNQPVKTYLSWSRTLVDWKWKLEVRAVDEMPRTRRRQIVNSMRKTNSKSEMQTQLQIEMKMHFGLL
jgi:hypothetical protein